MYGFYGGITTIFHSIVRFPIVAVCTLGIGYICLPEVLPKKEEPKNIQIELPKPTIESKPVEQPIKITPPIKEKKIMGSNDNIQLLISDKLSYVKR